MIESTTTRISFPSPRVILLIRLRYRLLWAQVRTSAGRRSLFFGLSFIGVSLMLCLWLGGIGAAVAGIQSGHGPAIARWILLFILLNGFSLGVLLGSGPRRAFSDSALRRYPMSPYRRLVARHVVGLFDPLWMFLLALAVGLSMGFSILGKGSLIAALPAGALYVVMTYLFIQVLLLSVHRTLSPGRAEAVTTGFLFLLFTAFSLAVCIFVTYENSHDWVRSAEYVLDLLPPGVAASIITGGTFQSVVTNAAILVGWFVVLLLAVHALERRPSEYRYAGGGEISWNNPYDTVAVFFGPALSPLVGKALRYQLRCTRVRLNCLLAILLTDLMPLLLGRNAHATERFLVTLTCFFFGGIAATGSAAPNQFAYDGAGIRRYLILPRPFGFAVWAGSLASLLVGGAVMLLAIPLYWMIPGNAFEFRTATMILSSGVAGLLFFNGLSLWTTVLSPRSADFYSVAGNQLPVTSLAVVMLGPASIPFVLTIFGRTSYPVLLSFWWVFPFIAVVCAGFYLACWRSIDKVAESRREQIVQAIAGSDAN